MCVCYGARGVRFRVCLPECVCETYTNAQEVRVKVLFALRVFVFRCKLVRRCLQCAASSPPRPPYGHLETLILRCMRVCECVRACV